MILHGLNGSWQPGRVKPSKTRKTMSMCHRCIAEELASACNFGSNMDVDLCFLLVVTVIDIIALVRHFM